MINYLLEREATFPGEHIVDTIFRELLEMATTNPASNVIVLPILATFDVLIGGGLAAEAPESQERRKMYALWYFVSLFLYDTY